MQFSILFDLFPFNLISNSAAAIILHDVVAGVLFGLRILFTIFSVDLLGDD